MDPDYEKAAKYYQQSIGLYNTDAQALFNLGMLHYEGKGVSKDPILCKDLLMRAADLGNDMAQRNIGTFLLNGSFQCDFQAMFTLEFQNYYYQGSFYKRMVCKTINIRDTFWSLI